MSDNPGRIPDGLLDTYARFEAQHRWQDDLNRQMEEQSAEWAEAAEEEGREKEQDRAMARKFWEDAAKERTDAFEERRVARADREQAAADRAAQLEEAATARREAAEQHERHVAEVARQREEDQRVAAAQRAEDKRASDAQHATDQRYRRITVAISLVALVVSGSFGAYAAFKPVPPPTVVEAPADSSPQLPAPR